MKLVVYGLGKIQTSSISRSNGSASSSWMYREACNNITNTDAPEKDMEINFWLFDLMIYVPFNNFSVMLGCFLSEPVLSR